jgi:uncharacterized protein RhaS with RHS repeats
MRGRYYMPALGRFMVHDPIGIAGGLNVYAYDDPVDFSDPTGLCTSTLYDGAAEAGEASESASEGSPGNGFAAYFAANGILQVGQGYFGGQNGAGVGVGIVTGIVGGLSGGLLPNTGGSGAGGDVNEFYQGQNGGGLTLVQGLGSPTPSPTPGPNCGQQCWNTYKDTLRIACGEVGVLGGAGACALGCSPTLLGGAGAYGSCLGTCGKLVGGAISACAAAATIRYFQCKRSCSN